MGRKGGALLNRTVSRFEQFLPRCSGIVVIPDHKLSFASMKLLPILQLLSVLSTNKLLEKIGQNNPVMGSSLKNVMGGRWLLEVLFHAQSHF